MNERAMSQARNPLDGTISGGCRALVLLFMIACGGTTDAKPVNACDTPARVVTCDEQNFYTFTLVSVDGEQPTWLGSMCREHACVRGDACEVQGSDGNFLEGVCQ